MHRIYLHLVKYHLIIVIKFKKQKIFQSINLSFNIIEKICEGLRSKVDQFVENDYDKIHEILPKYQKYIDRIKTIGQLEQFFHYTPKRFKLGARINVQPISISRIKPKLQEDQFTKFFLFSKFLKNFAVFSQFQQTFIKIFWKFHLKVC